MILNRFNKYMSDQYKGIKGLMTTSYRTPKVYTPQERRQNQLRNLMNPLSASRYSVDSYKKGKY